MCWSHLHDISLNAWVIGCSCMCVVCVSVCVLPDHRLWYGLQAGRDLHPLLPLLSPRVREHVEVVRAELSRVRQLHGRDEVGTKYLHREGGTSVVYMSGQYMSYTGADAFTGHIQASEGGRWHMLFCWSDKHGTIYNFHCWQLIIHEHFSF